MCNAGRFCAFCAWHSVFAQKEHACADIHMDKAVAPICKWPAERHMRPGPYAWHGKSKLASIHVNRLLTFIALDRRNLQNT